MSEATITRDARGTAPVGGVDARGVRSTAPVGPAPVAPEHGRGWRRRLGRAVVAADLMVVVAVSALAALCGVRLPYAPWNPASTLWVGVVAVGLVLAALPAFRCWDRRVLGQGTEEFTRVLRAVLTASVVLALAGLALKADDVRPWVFGVLPATGGAVLAGRCAIRRVLHRARLGNACMSSVLVVGTDEVVADLVARTRRARHHGWDVVAACTSTGTARDGQAEIAGVPVVGDLDEIAAHVQALGVGVVAVAPSPGWTPKRLHRLAWELEGHGVELVVEPGLMEVTGPRLHLAPVDGLPLIRVTEPRFAGAARLAKNALDRCGAATLLMLFAPLFLTVAVLVRKDGGPVFFRQERVGKDGRIFRMVKFRSMEVGADKQVDALAAANEAAGPLFKMRDDPRVTRVGAFLRRLSLDELPQLLNVVGGSMSLVGPRPPLGREVASYGQDALRKLRVRPGMTGLWQVSGRSDLSWEESVRLDLRYVENWSLMLDISILWRTVGAVVGSRGAY